MRLMRYMFRMTDSDLRVDESDAGWVLGGPAAPRFSLVNEFLGYLADRRYSPKTVRAYAFDLLAFCRWLADEGTQLGDVTAEMLLRYLSYCRTATFRGRPGGNVYSIRDGRSTGYAAATVNRRMAAISGMFEFRAMRDPDKPSPVPRARPAARPAAASGAGCWDTWPRRGRRRNCGSGSPAGCRKGLMPSRPRPCWTASAAGGTRQSPGSCCCPACAPPRCSR